MVQTNNGGIIERIPGFDIGRVMSQGFGARQLPDDFGGAASSEASRLEFEFPESRIGRDDRVPIGDTTSLPWRCICHLVVDGLHRQQLVGTGWLAGPRTVITAGHNLYSVKRRRQAVRVTVVPGRQGNQAPFNFFRSSRLDVHPQWRSTGVNEYDLGVIWLGSPVGEQTGWFGFGSRPDSLLSDLIVNTAGYPADKRTGTQWFNAGRVSHVTPQTLQYGLDTETGQSGSPVFMVDANGERTVLAVHAYGGEPVNRGIRITDEIFGTMQAWIR